MLSALHKTICFTSFFAFGDTSVKPLLKLLVDAPIGGHVAPISDICLALLFDRIADVMFDTCWSNKDLFDAF